MMDGIIATDHADETGGVPQPLGYLVPRQPKGIRSRLHPWAVLGVWAWQTMLALVAAYPAASLVRVAYGTSPRGDEPLWDPGGHALLDLLFRESHGVSAAAGGAAIVLIVGAVAGLLPLASLMTTMAHGTHGGHPIGAARALAGAARCFRPMALLLVSVTLAEGAAVAAAVGAGETIEAAAHRWLGEAHAQVLGAGVGALLLCAACALGVVHDLARAAVVRFHLGGLRAWIVGARSFRQSPFRLAFSWGWRAAASVVPVAAVALVANRIGGRGGLALFGLALLHQAVVVTRVSLRASWLAKALRSVDLGGSTE